MRIANSATSLERFASGKFLGLKHLRGAHQLIPEVAQLVNDPKRLADLSDICGIELEPYPFSKAGSHINYYEANRLTISYHTDGPPFVELIPLLLEGEQKGGSTLVFNGNPREGLSKQQLDREMSSAAAIALPHKLGNSILMQGRSLFHAAESLTRGRRITLVLPMRSKKQPWKDNNTLERLLLDDNPEDVIDEWIKDAVERRFPALKATLADIH